MKHLKYYLLFVFFAGVYSSLKIFIFKNEIDKLFISKRTVDAHRQKVIDKIGAKNTVGLVVYAITNKLYTLPDF